MRPEGPKRPGRVPESFAFRQAGETAAGAKRPGRAPEATTVTWDGERPGRALESSTVKRAEG